MCSLRLYDLSPHQIGGPSVIAVEPKAADSSPSHMLFYVLQNRTSTKVHFNITYILHLVKEHVRKLHVFVRSFTVSGASVAHVSQVRTYAMLLLLKGDAGVTLHCIT